MDNLEGKIKKYKKALDITCEELVKMCKQTNCKNCHFVKEQTDCLNDCPVKGNLTPCDWEEWAIEKAERR